MNTTRRSLFRMGALGLAAPAILSAMPAMAKAPQSGANPLYQRRKLGAFEVTVLLDGTLDLAPELLVGYDQGIAENTLKQAHRDPKAGMILPVLGHIINTGDRLIAVDSGTVEGFAPRLAGYHAAMAAAGLRAQDVDTVLLTHLHPDHIGGLADASGNRLFPNAQVFVGATEWNFWHDEAIYAGVPDESKGFFDMARTYVAPYDGRITTFEGETEVIPGVLAVPLPGHTVGHTGFRFNSEGQDLLIWGDLIHSSSLQFANPDWLIVFDADPEMTRKSRRMMLDMAATDGFLCTGSHIDFPGFGYVEQRGDAYHFAPAPFDYMSA